MKIKRKKKQTYSKFLIHFFPRPMHVQNVHHQNERKLKIKLSYRYCIFFAVIFFSLKMYDNLF